jgi:hypothetical protein
MKPKAGKIADARAGFLNRARPSDRELKAKTQHSDCCSDPLLFAMRDNHHQFSMGLFTILQCLRVAEKEGHVPPLPEGWWTSVEYSYGEHYCGRFK